MLRIRRRLDMKLKRRRIMHLHFDGAGIIFSGFKKLAREDFASPIYIT